ncbi:unnamed protein product [Clonostachys chloroleuca]|uniref:Signal recognition particle SEC65 subunit n=1 Tax=Clonostachys chloroleuca TaxID=1926264 RepID=A0AA35MHS8_9HYPO|nr:unnamed protein product [Clonostachys chloroleuca]
MSHPRVEEVSDSDLSSDPEEVDIDDFDDADIMRRVEPAAKQPSPATPRAPPVQAQQQQAAPTSSIHVNDRAAYASYQCLYPIYFDASRSRSEGRRVPSSLAVANPLAREIANACSRLRLPTLLEPDKIHPKDWANPGRVKVGLKAAGSQANKPLHNKHHLFILVARHLRDNPTNDDSLGLRVRVGGKLEPEMGKPYPRPAVPRGWKLGELLPYTSAAMTGGGVSENLFKDMMKEMQSGGDPMSALMGGMGGAGGGGGGSGAGSGAEESSGSGKKKKDKKKGRA